MISFNKIVNFFLHAHFFAFSVFATLFTFFFFAGGFVVANGQTLAPADSHIVNIYVDGKSSTVPTREATVGSFLTKAGVVLSNGDKVEPAAATPITQDNFNIQVFRAKPYTVTDGITSTSILSPESSLSLIAKQAGYDTVPEDIITLSTPDNFTNQNVFGSIVTIKRAIQVNAILYGSTPASYMTQALTVGDFLREKGINPVAGATILPSVDQSIESGMLISISKPGNSIVTLSEDIPFAVQSTPDPTAPIGTKKIITPGVIGKRQVIYNVVMKDGVQVSKTEISSVISEQPQAQVEKNGTMLPVVTSQSVIDWMQQAGISASDYYYVDFIISHEGGWNGVLKWNYAGSGAYGICQALPGSKMASAGSDWATNPVTQLRWCNNYANKYGGWAGAYNFWVINMWW
jgi:resuscitation-promoting factor RpfB